MAEIIRLIKKEELNDLLALYEHLNSDDGDLAVDTRVHAVWDGILADPGQRYLVAEVDGRLVSSCVLTIIQNLTRQAAPYGLIENVVTHPEYRHRGIGTRVLQRALVIAREQGCYKVMLLTGRREAIPFYEQAGFDGRSKTGFIVRFDGR
ncbi:GNAT family N-acetyltransferase [Methanosphaerula palustris]|uniref:GCN5-related N-acetyltransferase n=1 Tax=Methanosphaerula palustris (strain ATCC BAA-1556 / DSM 19958 / E1-9c) TaxID=521011 RepID=B8GI95_METPE|nr:GNAT family N-acetyltransferase [Methanosphaerula palustris]ACL15446.1 GCN5-related N-acetyltransferase [Methanosphaerula palustris E1-9c]